MYKKPERGEAFCRWNMGMQKLNHRDPPKKTLYSSNKGERHTLSNMFVPKTFTLGREMKASRGDVMVRPGDKTAFLFLLL